MGKRVWVDFETTGLNLIGPRPDVPLELGIVITDEWGRIEAENSWIIWEDANPDWHFALDRAKEHQYVNEMHTKSGLWDTFHNPSVKKWRPEVAANTALAWLRRHGIEKNSSAMHGSSIHFDRLVMQIHMPELEKHFHYRNVDVSTLKILCSQFNPELYAKLDWETNIEKQHRAVSDCMDSIHEFLVYVDNFLFVKD